MDCREPGGASSTATCACRTSWVCTPSSALGLFALLVGTGWSATRRVRLVLAAASSYTALFALLLWQALRAQSIMQPDGITLVALAVWSMATAAAVYAATRSESLRRAALVY